MNENLSIANKVKIQKPKSVFIDLHLRFLDHIKHVYNIYVIFLLILQINLILDKTTVILCNNLIHHKLQVFVSSTYHMNHSFSLTLCVVLF